MVAGFPDGTYGPALPVTRDQMAVDISRALAGGDAAVPTPPTGTQSFPDVTSTYWAYKYIEYAKAKGVVAGFPDGTYQPAVVVTRDQMAVYIALAIATPMAGADLVNYTPPATTIPRCAHRSWATSTWSTSLSPASRLPWAIRTGITTPRTCARE